MFFDIKISAKKIILITGLTRSGKTLLCPIISSLKNCEQFFFNTISENVSVMHYMKKINFNTANYIVKKEINENTFVIFNPPYGERIKITDKEFYNNIGTTLKHNYLNSEVWIISSDIENMKFIGLKPTTKFKIINSNLECSFRQFLIYSGSKKQKNSE